MHILPVPCKGRMISIQVMIYIHVNNAFGHYFYDLGAAHNLFMELPHVRHLTIQECVKWIEKRADISND